jgi:hypothetical protein
MKRRKKYKPYIRRAKSSDYSSDLFVAAGIGLYYEMRKRNYYVLVQHGAPNKVIKAAISKHEIKRKVAIVKTFSSWAKWIKHYCHKRKVNKKRV